MLQCRPAQEFCFGPRALKEALVSTDPALRERYVSSFTPAERLFLAEAYNPRRTLFCTLLIRTAFDWVLSRPEAPEDFQTFHASLPSRRQSPARKHIYLQPIDLSEGPAGGALLEHLRDCTEAFFLGLQVRCLPSVAAASIHCSSRPSQDSDRLQLHTEQQAGGRAVRAGPHAVRPVPVRGLELHLWQVPSRPRSRRLQLCPVLGGSPAVGAQRCRPSPGRGGRRQPRDSRAGRRPERGLQRPGDGPVLQGHVPRALPPPGPGELSLAALPHAGGAQPGRGPAAAPGPLSHLPAEAAARPGLQARREVQGREPVPEPHPRDWRGSEEGGPGARVCPRLVPGCCGSDRALMEDQGRSLLSLCPGQRGTGETLGAALGRGVRVCGHRRVHGADARDLRAEIRGKRSKTRDFTPGRKPGHGRGPARTQGCPRWWRTPSPAALTQA
uniref:archaemetzincin-1 isoform X11 n=1 Tax=Halichoerus grypus TaxID=9711 RepID=UPI0016591EA2|nr:archaemetzincin-1 isoform X11 [Halichoerus grypus]